MVEAKGRLACCLLAVVVGVGLTTAQEPIGYDRLLRDLLDLDRLTNVADPPYELQQISSYDRRAVSPDQPGWFANWDGYSPDASYGFAQVLEAAEGDRPGRYLLCDLAGPGVLVRTWSARMAGRLTVWLDDGEAPLFAGPGEDFLCRRSELLLARAGLVPANVPLFRQAQADYMPLPFAKRLRIEWQGLPTELRYYHLNIRRYAEGTRLTAFDPERTLAAHANVLREITAAAAALGHDAAQPTTAIDLAPGAVFDAELTPSEPSVIDRLVLRLDSAQRAQALRGTLLRLRFDDAAVAQVEAPAGDFFGAGPGVQPFASLPMGVLGDGTMICRFPMPFRSRAKLQLVNTTRERVQGSFAWQHHARPFTAATMYFRAKWRVDHQLEGHDEAGAYDLPFLWLRGGGRVVGTACMVFNPPTDPISGSWWGEGDEKVWIDDDRTPRLFGTGSEDLFNYAWGSHDLFDAVFSGQPLVSGRFCSQFVANHRFLIADDLPFERSLTFAVELWRPQPAPPLSYGRVVWLYARPGAVDDHRALQPADLRLPGSVVDDPTGLTVGGRTTLVRFAQAAVTATGTTETVAQAGAPVLRWSAAAGQRLQVGIEVCEAGDCRLELGALLQPRGAQLGVLLDGRPLPAERIDLRAERVTPGRFRCAAGRLARGTHQLTLECTGDGLAELGWIVTTVERWAPLQLPDAVEAESLPVIAKSDGVTVEAQPMPDQAWSGGALLAVRGVRAGDFAVLEVPVAPGRWRVAVHPTARWDGGVVRLGVQGTAVSVEIDTYRPFAAGAAPLAAVDLGEHQGGTGLKLRIDIAGVNAAAPLPKYGCALDAVVLTPVLDRR